MFRLRLRELRERAGFSSQQSFADAFGVAQSTVGGWESGKREPNYETTKRLATFFHVTIDYLLGIVDENGSYAEALRNAVMSSNQPVSWLCLVYGIDAKILNQICGPDVISSSGFSAEEWVLGISFLKDRINPPSDLFPKGEMLNEISDFFGIAQSSLSNGQSLPLVPNQQIQRKVDILKLKNLKLLNIDLALFDGAISENTPSISDEAMRVASAFDQADPKSKDMVRLALAEYMPATGKKANASAG